MEGFKTQGLFQAGVLVSDVDECKRLFSDVFGMHVVLDARDAVQTAKGLSGVDRQIMNVLILRGEDGADLELHQYVDPPAKPHAPMSHSDIGSMHFMLRVDGIENAVQTVERLGYRLMTPVVERRNFKYAYFRGPDGMMVELQEGRYDSR